MFYLIYGTEDFLINQELNKIIKENNIDNIDINKYDLTETPLKSIIDDAFTLSLFSNNRFTVVYNSYIFTGSTSNQKQDTKILEQYLKKDFKNIVVFIVNSDNLDSRKKIVSLIKEKGKVIECNKNYNIKKIVKKMFDNYNIDDSDILFLIDRVGQNLDILNQEINKLKIYKDRDINITRDDIINVTVKTIDIDIFNLIDNIVLKRKDKSLKSYYEMIKRGEEPIKIIIMLANQFRLIYQVKNLKSKGVSIFDMITILGKKKYPIELALKKANNFTNKQLIKIISALADLDYNIKSGKIDKNIGLELFIICS